MRTFNKKGDKGNTSLLYGVTVAKSDPRCEAYGTIDEAVSVLGLARNFTHRRVQEIILSIQKDLFITAAELATPSEHRHKSVPERSVVTGDMVQHLEILINQLEEEINMPQAFIIPGETPGSAYLDLARTIIRRAERRVISLTQELPDENINEEILKYLNRLADLVFTLARFEEKTAL